MISFEKIKRQKYITEDYYLSTRHDLMESLSLYAEMQVEDDQYNCGEAGRWGLIAETNLSILLLEYTAGQSIIPLAKRFEQVIQSFENQCLHSAKFKKTKRSSSIQLRRGLVFWGLAVLLGHKNLIQRIALLTLGEQSDQDYWEYEILNRCFHLVNPDYTDPSRELLYDPYFDHLCKVIDQVLIHNNAREATQILKVYLKDWYTCRKGDFCYNAHRKMLDSSGYIGYWAFEVAALVYILDLDDTDLLKSKYYPKDLVQWVRNLTH